MLRPSLFVVLAVALCAPVAAQPAAGTASPRLTLVLSGGGAKGFAHVGAIQVFEEAGLPFDIVAGTSAGAMIGSLYAVGYSGQELEDLIVHHGGDLNDLFFDRVDSRLIRLAERRIPDATLVRFPVDGLMPRLPEGIVAGQRLVQFLSRYTWGYHHVEDFRELPRPFACNAIDIVTGEDVVLDHGFLPEAARTCVSLPGFFKPVRRGEQVLIDGGPSHMLPVPEARLLGADVMVGVDVSGDVTDDLGPGVTEGSLASVFILSGSNPRRVVARSYRDSLAVVVTPDIRGISSNDYNTAPAFIARGRAAAEAVLPQIRALLDSLGHPVRASVPAPTLAPVDVGALDLQGVDGAAADYVRALLGFDLPERLGPDDVDLAVSRVFATQLFETVRYRLLPDPAGGPATLEVVVTPFARPDRLGLGFRYDDTFGAGVLLTLELRNRVTYGSTLGLVARLGQQAQLRASYFDRFGLTSPLTFGLGVDLASAPLRVPTRPDAGGGAPDVVATYQQRTATATALAGYALGNATLVGVQGAASVYEEEVREYPITDADLILDPATGQRRAPQYLGAGIRGRFASIAAFAESQVFDRRVFPTRGHRVRLTAEAGTHARNDDEVIQRIEAITGPLPRSPDFNTFRGFQRVVADAEGRVRLTPAVSVFGRAAYARGSAGVGLPLVYYNTVGGVNTTTVFPGSALPLPGLRTQERIGQAAWLAMVGTQWVVRPKTMVQLYAGAGDAFPTYTAEQVAERPELDDAQRLQFGRAALGVGAALGWASPVGPAVATVGYAGDGRPVTLSFSLGHTF